MPKKKSKSRSKANLARSQAMRRYWRELRTHPRKYSARIRASLIGRARKSLRQKLKWDILIFSQIEKAPYAIQAMKVLEPIVDPAVVAHSDYAGGRALIHAIRRSVSGKVTATRDDTVTFSFQAADAQSFWRRYHDAVRPIIYGEEDEPSPTEWDFELHRLWLIIETQTDAEKLQRESNR